MRKLLLVAESATAVDATRPAWEKIVGDRAEVTQAVPNMLEVLPRGNDKARGVATLLAHLGVERSRVVAVGDGENGAGISPPRARAWRWGTRGNSREGRRSTSSRERTTKTASPKPSESTFCDEARERRYREAPRETRE